MCPKILLLKDFLVKVLVFDCIFWEADFDKNKGVTGPVAPVAGTVDAPVPAT